MPGHSPDAEGHENSRSNSPECVVPMLMQDEPAPLKIRHILVMKSMIPKDEPADMRIKKSFFDAVGILIRINIAVMIPVLGSPFESRLLERGGSEKKHHKTDKGVCLKGGVGE